MANIYVEKKLISLEVRGNYAYPWGCGDYRCGFNLLGEENDQAGTYQRDHSQYGPIFRKHRYSVEYVSSTPDQLVCRANFRAGKVIWDALDPSVKQAWKDRKWPQAMSGYNRFMSAYLKGMDLTP